MTELVNITHRDRIGDGSGSVQYHARPTVIEGAKVFAIYG